MIRGAWEREVDGVSQAFVYIDERDRGNDELCFGKLLTTLS